MAKVIFVCVHNAGRSQMAEAFFNKLAEGKGVASSAGTAPSQRINDDVDKVMLEIGIDMWAQKPKLLTEEMVEDADMIITMGCGVEGVCPASFLTTEEWQVEDPEGKPVEQIRKIRDEIKNRVIGLLARL